MTPEERKARPIASGVLAYFPDAIMEVANCSYVGNQQHNPGQPLHWAREKSTDHDDALLRHETDRLAGTVLDTDGVRHRTKVVWRALAALQTEIEQERAVATDELEYALECVNGPPTKQYLPEAAKDMIERTRPMDRDTRSYRERNGDGEGVMHGS